MVSEVGMDPVQPEAERQPETAPEILDRQRQHIPLSSKVVEANCSKAFQRLPEQERLYVHHLTKASWIGGLIILLQTSPESAAIFVLLQNLFRYNSLAELENFAKQTWDFTDDDWLSWKRYVAVFYDSLGNYRGFGDTKIVPEVAKAKVEKLVFGTAFHVKKPELVKKLWNLCGARMYDVSPPRLLQLNKHTSSPVPEGISVYRSWYYDANSYTLADFYKKNSIELDNIRIFQTPTHDGKKHLELRLASTLDCGPFTIGKLDVNGLPFDAKNHAVTFTRGGAGINYNVLQFEYFCDILSILGMDCVRMFSSAKDQCIQKIPKVTGDYSLLLREVLEYVRKAAHLAPNNVHQEILGHYVEFFKTGMLTHHKEATKAWIKTGSQLVEFVWGFLHTARDPNGTSGEFMGIVGATPDHAEKEPWINKLRDSWKPIIEKLPWPREYEKDDALVPTVQQLDVFCYVSSCHRTGITFPSYDDMQQELGNRCLRLRNTYATSYPDARSGQYLRELDLEMLNRFAHVVDNIKFGLGEVIARATGKFFVHSPDGKANFSKDVEDFEAGGPPSFYDAGTTFRSMFGHNAAMFEETRANLIILYLSLFPEVLHVFEVDRDDVEDVAYCVWLDVAVTALQGLPFYNLEIERWGNDVAGAKWTVLDILLEEEIVKIEIKKGTDGRNDLILIPDRDLLRSKGHQVLKPYLKRAQLYKSTANSEEALMMFGEHSYIHPSSDAYNHWHTIAADRLIPPPLLVQANTFLDSQGKVTIKSYPASLDGLIQSFQERYDQPEILEEALLILADRDAAHFDLAQLK